MAIGWLRCGWAIRSLVPIIRFKNDDAVLQLAVAADGCKNPPRLHARWSVESSAYRPIAVFSWFAVCLQSVPATSTQVFATLLHMTMPAVPVHTPATSFSSSAWRLHAASPWSTPKMRPLLKHWIFPCHGVDVGVVVAVDVGVVVAVVEVVGVMVRVVLGDVPVEVTVELGLVVCVDVCVEVGVLVTVVVVSDVVAVDVAVVSSSACTFW